MAAARVVLPCVNTWSGHGDFCEFLQALEPYWDPFTDVTFDFSRCNFLSAEGAAILAAFKLKRECQWGHTVIDWETVQGKVHKQLGRWGLAKHFGGEHFPWRGNAIPLFHQASLESKKLVEYTCTWIQSGSKMPVMSAALTKEVRRSFCELFQNIYHHANSPFGGVAIGQLYPNLKQVQICVCDAGVGIVRRVTGAGHALSPAKALAWSLQEGTTTRNDPQGPPGGLGLYFLRKFVMLNGGNLRIMANKGYLCQEPDRLTTETLSAEMPGTLFQFKFLIRDDVTYTLALEDDEVA